MSTVCGFGMDLEQAQADGRITVGDADEVRRFAAFLSECGPRPSQPGFNRERFRAAYAEHYPEDYAATFGEAS